jgi:hypothetical protein
MTNTLRELQRYPKSPTTRLELDAALLEVAVLSLRDSIKSAIKLKENDLQITVNPSMRKEQLAVKYLKKSFEEQQSILADQIRLEILGTLDRVNAVLDSYSIWEFKEWSIQPTMEDSQAKK